MTKERRKRIRVSTDTIDTFCGGDRSRASQLLDNFLREEPELKVEYKEELGATAYTTIALSETGHARIMQICHDVDEISVGDVAHSILETIVVRQGDTIGDVERYAGEASLDDIVRTMPLQELVELRRMVRIAGRGHTPSRVLIQLPVQSLYAIRPKLAPHVPKGFTTVLGYLVTVQGRQSDKPRAVARPIPSESGQEGQLISLLVSMQEEDPTFVNEAVLELGAIDKELGAEAARAVKQATTEKARGQKRNAGGKK